MPDAAQRLALMRLLLLHRYSNLPTQIAGLGWQCAQSFEELTALIWPWLARNEIPRSRRLPATGIGRQRESRCQPRTSVNAYASGRGILS